MQFYNIKHPEEKVSFKQALTQGLGRDQGLFFPETLPHFADIDAVLALPFLARCEKIFQAFLSDDLNSEQIQQMVQKAFNFPLNITKVNENSYALELFHGPTLAFKDFGARFMAQALNQCQDDKKITILTATSGDTGAAVAHAFYGLENIDVVVLYPKGKISPLQEKLFCTLGKNIRTVAINGDFDACQALVKQAFDDKHLREEIGLNSANSINISRLLAQICYYFEAVAQLPKNERENVVFSVPSGNFGNLTAGLIAKAMGLPARFIAATNENDTVPRYLLSGNWQPNETVATLSNAMDVSRPNNWPRIEELFQRKNWPLSDLHSGMLSDEETEKTLQKMNQQGYLCEPHGAIAFEILQQDLKAQETGIFLCTAHPAKFKESVERILACDLPLPENLAKYADKPLLSTNMDADFAQLKAYLLK